MKKISFFNHKGGVSKTTTSFHTGWMLAERGYKVLLVDADPQCNLTGLIFGYNETNNLETFYSDNNINNIKDAVSPAFEAKPVPLKAVDCYTIPERNNLFLLPGHIGLAEYDVTLGIAQELSGSLQTLRNLPGAFHYLFQRISEKYEIDYIIIDMSPSLSSINRNLLMISDYFIVPSAPDFYSLMALDSLTKILTDWMKWAKEAQKLKILQEAEYPFPQITPKFIGTIIQRYRLRNQKASQGFQTFIDKIYEKTKMNLIPSLASNDMLLDQSKYQLYLDANYCLALISDFNSLIATSQDYGKPVYAITEADLNHWGIVLQGMMGQIAQFNKTYNDIVEKIIGLTI